ncbi:MAG: Smr/MutS family protein [Gammaproteobacteria bacterium]
MTKKLPPTEDIQLFRDTVGKVSAIRNDKVLLQKEEKPKPFPRTRFIDLEGHLVDANQSVVDKVSSEDIIEYTAPGLQKNVIKKLRRGHYGLDAESDLHGLTSFEAKRQLLIFLHHCVESGYRCVLIIHGKGYRSSDDHPVLKNDLNQWLRQHKDVQAFCTAPGSKGGAGAVLVLLRFSEKFSQFADA